MAATRRDIATRKAKQMVDREGRAITYTPDGGTARSVKAIVAISDQIETRVFDDGEQRVQRGRIVVSTDATIGVPSLQPGDRFTIDALVWAPDQGAATGEWGMTAIDLVRNVGERKGNRERIERGL